MEIATKKKPGLLTAVGIGVGCMIGSGWLFSAYYAAQYTGSASYLSWGIGAFFSLILALLLAEIVSLFKQKALFSRLLTLSHDNMDLGYVIAISNWLGLVIVIPTEASATVQYLSTAIPSLTHYFFINQQHTLLGSACIILLVIIYLMINFWGMQILAKVTNVIAIFKLIVPVVTALLLMVSSFHTENFSAHGFAPYGVNRIFSAVVVCGIFYAFYGFAMVAMYASELENPQKNIPRALILSILISFLIYILLQTAFIGSLPPDMVTKGWSQLNFTSPFAQLLILLDLHLLYLWSMVLYFDAAVSPSGTAIIYLGSAGRTVTGMAQDKQFPRYFDKVHPVYRLSRRSLLFTTAICCFILVFFKNWQELMILVSVFQLISCVAIPVAFTRLRNEQPNSIRLYRVRFGKSLSYLIFLVVSFLLLEAEPKSLLLALVLHLVFFLLYAFNFYQHQLNNIIFAFYSSSSLFVYMVLVTVFGFLKQYSPGYTVVIYLFFMGFMTYNFMLLIQQKNHSVRT